MELRINLFGSVGVFRSGHRLPDFPTHKSRALFCFLVLNRSRVHPRDVLMGILWGDKPDDVARKNLRTDIWRIRRILEPRGVARGTYLVAEKDSVGFNSSTNYWLDVEDFERRIERYENRAATDLTRADSDQLRNAVGLYRGDLLEGLYDEWCVVEQERLRAKLLMTLEKLMRFHAARREWSSALVYGHRVLQNDPLREHIHRDVMRYHYLQGNRPAALTQYRACERLLKKELGIGPMRETQQLRDAIAEERVAVEANARPGRLRERVRQERSVVGSSILDEIRDALRDFQDASTRLHAGLRKFEGLKPMLGNELRNQRR